MTTGQEFAKGDTIRLKGTFKDFSGVLTDPSALALKIYDSTGTVVLTKAITDMTHASTGVYYYDWTTTATGDFIYEFTGTLAAAAMVVWDTLSVIYH
jgi:hypothetical protein